MVSFTLVTGLGFPDLPHGRRPRWKASLESEDAELLLEMQHRTLLSLGDAEHSMLRSERGQTLASVVSSALLYSSEA